MTAGFRPAQTTMFQTLCEVWGSFVVIRTLPLVAFTPWNRFSRNNRVTPSTGCSSISYPFLPLDAVSIREIVEIKKHQPPAVNYFSRDSLLSLIHI